MGKGLPFFFRKNSRRRLKKAGGLQSPPSAPPPPPLRSPELIDANHNNNNNNNSLVVGASTGPGKGKKKAGGAARLWMRFDRLGNSELVECDKSAIIKRVSIPARDLRILGPVFSHSSNILGNFLVLLLVILLFFFLSFGFLIFIIVYSQGESHGCQLRVYKGYSDC